MTPRQQVSRAALDLVKRFEGYRQNAAQLPDGRWTIGYGHLRSAREGAQVSEADAEALLLYDLMAVADALDELVYASLTDNESAALTAFALAIGLDAFRASEVLKRVNAGEPIQAAYAIELWRRAEVGGESLLIDALVRRRAAEKLLFLTPPGEAWRPAPAALLKAQLDLEGADTAPRAEAASVTSSLEGPAVHLTRDDAAISPVTAAAEAVTSRLQTLFPEMGPAGGHEPAVEQEVALAGPPSDDLAMPAPPRGEDPMPRVVQEEPPAYEFVAAPSAAAQEPDGGPLAIAALILLGVAFFSGGIFWGLNAQPGLQGGVFTPLLVGWLAGVAGVGLIASATFMLLQRLARSADRRGRRTH